MKKTNLILLFLMALVCFGCHKDKEMNAKDPIVSNVEMTVSETQARFSWQVDFAGEFHTCVEVSQDENMSDLKRVEASKEGDKFVAVVDGLSAGTKLYYRIIVWNKFNNYEQEVKEFSTTPYTISVSFLPEGGGKVTGEGTYSVGDTCILKVSANAGYTFLNWTENGNQLSKEVVYSFVVTSDRHIVANFILVPTGAIKGLFTINENGDQVFFSQGNLQYHTGDSVWRFAEHQYDTIGMDNNHIVYNGCKVWIDIFCWGTGNNPTNTSPYDGDYHNFVDWGDNVIFNGGNQSGMWHTLSMEDWQYLFNRRPSANFKYGIGNVQGIGGLIILPDNWACPTNIVFNPGFSSDDGDWTHNSYTVSQWQMMENEGAVFLPAAGIKQNGIGFCAYWGINYFGHYWSFSGSYEFPSCLRFDSTVLNFEDASIAYFGRSVRLVCPTE